MGTMMSSNSFSQTATVTHSAVTNIGNTPLHCACQNGHSEVAKCLVNAHKSNPEHGNMNGFTPLHSAVSNGHLAVMEYLIIACEKGHLEVAKYLVNEHKSNPEQGNVNGYIPLHSAVNNGHLAVMKYLISELGCNLQIHDNYGLTPPHYATLNEHHDIIKFLISDCCDLQCVQMNGLLHFILLVGMVILRLQSIL